MYNNFKMGTSSSLLLSLRGGFLAMMLSILICLFAMPIVLVVAKPVHDISLGVQANSSNSNESTTMMTVTMTNQNVKPGKCQELVDEVVILKKKLSQMKTHVWRFEGSLNTVNLIERLENENQLLTEEITKLRNISQEKDQTIAWLKEQIMEKKKNFDLFAKIDEHDMEAIKSYVMMGADVNRTNNNRSKESPLHRAAKLHDKDVALKIIIVLIDNNADVFAKDGEDYTFLHRLVDDGTNLTPRQFHELSTFLVSKNLTGIFGTEGISQRYYNTSVTPFQLAVKNLEVESSTLSMLQRNGVNFTGIDGQGNSILFYGIMGNRSARLLFELIALGANKEYRNPNKDNDTLLHTAAEYGSVEQIKLFLYLGLDINSLNDLGKTPLHKAVQGVKGNVLEKVALLLDKAADVKIKTKDGESAFDFVLKRNDLVDQDKILHLLTEKN